MDTMVDMDNRRLAFRSCVFAICVVMVWGGAVLGDQGEQNAAKKLPEPLKMNSGRRVKSADAWPKRREQIIDMLVRIQYGHIPPAPGNVAVDTEQAPDTTGDGVAVHRAVMLKFGPHQSLKMGVDLYMPRDGAGPWPVVLHVGADEKAIAQIVGRGYAYACYDQHALDPDPGEGKDVVGAAQTAYPKYDWGSIGVWAWGASRALDYLLTVPELNRDQIIVTGHSRRGKTALLAGALDERFAMVVPNGSGCGGAGCYRVLGPNSETLKLITLPKRFKSWFQEDFGRYADREDELPFDQHFVKALVAPRLLLSTDALGDLWANPLGTQATYLAAQPVFDLLGAPGNNALSFREGGHEQNEEDYAALLDFADLHFRGKATARPFDKLPFPNEAAR
ncbi:MAG: hypothetical protein FJY92_07160 [Candidatus Hydrogenedentes bacterium]|nr:hypothetical protein [Candidatus Hydrogenedentota bacterium]